MSYNKDSRYHSYTSPNHLTDFADSEPHHIIVNNEKSSIVCGFDFASKALKR